MINSDKRKAEFFALVARYNQVGALLPDPDNFDPHDAAALAEAKLVLAEINGEGEGRVGRDDGTAIMISLNDAQLKTVMAAASHVPHEKRDLYLQRVAAMLTLRGRGHFIDSGVGDTVKLALVGMVHENAA